MSSYMQEVLGISGILLVKAFTKERAERRRFGDINHELRRLEIRETMIGRWFGLLNQASLRLARRSCCWVAISSSLARQRWAQLLARRHHPRRPPGRLRRVAGQPVCEHHRIACVVRAHFSDCRPLA